MALLTVRVSALMPQGESPAAAPLTGIVAETMDGGRYTYLRVEDAGGASHWVAASQMPVAVGERVTVGGGTPMVNFTSPTLNRTFERILFSEDVQVGTNRPAAAALPPGHPPVGAAGAHGMGARDGAAPGLTGEVVETMDTGNYTYVRVRDGTRTVWAATERFAVKVGDRVTVPPGMVMKKFESPSLGRTFDELYFVDFISAEGAAPAGAVGHAASPTESVQAVVAQPDGGLSIAEIYARRAELVGQEVTVRGRVVKSTQGVLDRNWLHLADGTGEGDGRDVTITTEASARVGDVVTARGRVSVDEDLGHGYRFPVLVKDAALLPP